MPYKQIYHSPLGELILASADGENLTALCFAGSRDDDPCIAEGRERDLPIFAETAKWLNIYFSGKNPDFIPKCQRNNLTPFRQDVAEEMIKIPYGETRTYGDIAAAIAKKRGLAKMSAQAVGGAVGWNPICIIIPCHRVVGASHNLVGYGGGMKNKIGLLKLEGINLNNYTAPA